jgi:hypothetical protein
MARQSTVVMIVWQVHRVRGLFWQLAGWIDCFPGRRWYRDRSRPDIDWVDKDARQDLVSLLVEDALRVAERALGQIEEDRAVWEAARAEALAKGRDPGSCRVFEPLADQVGLLALLAGQDVEPAEGSDGSDGRWRVAKRTAPDRIVSLVDTDARHARKTRAAKKDGFEGCGQRGHDDRGAVLAFELVPGFQVAGRHPAVPDPEWVFSGGGDVSRCRGHYKCGCLFPGQRVGDLPGLVGPGSTIASHNGVPGLDLVDGPDHTVGHNHLGARGEASASQCSGSGFGCLVG